MRNYKLNIDRDDNVIMTFGKYRGETLERIYKLDPDYLRWMAEKMGNLEIRWFLRVKEDKCI